MKHELLSPAGDMECLRQAVYNGADAVYFACKNFGARRFAKNFTNEEICEAIHFCHLYGVKAYVTMNTVVKNEEVEDFINQARFLHENGVDALIVQDFGMICLLREKFPNLEIHASTQANISSEEVCKLYYDLGVKRVVFSRELTIDEIDSIKVPIEKEAFIHGALCISYSGCCLMSSMLGGRSGNRGECAGVCRMPFSLEKNGKIIEDNKYLLSTKELNTSPKIDRLLKSSIYSFKIEGRMKGPLYVGFITRLYRKLLDQEEIDLEKETRNLKTIFTRDYTLGRMFYENDNNFMNTTSPNHKGLEIGKVIGFTKNKIKIKLINKESIHQYDAIRFQNNNKGFIINYLYDESDKLITSSNSICYVDNKINLNTKDTVYKTQDYLLEKEYEKYPSKKINISYKVEAFINKPLKIEISDGINTIKTTGNVIEEAKSSPISKDNLKNQLEKLGDTPFISKNCIINMDNSIFISLKHINELRRDLVSKLIKVRENYKKEVIIKKVNFEKDNTEITIPKTSCFVYTKEQLEETLPLFDRIYVNDIDLYELYKDNEKIYYYPRRCTFNKEKYYKKRCILSDFGDYHNTKVLGNYPLNVTNIYTAYYLKKKGYSSISLSVELTKKEVIDFISTYHEKFGFMNFELLCFGRVENMIIKGNILSLEELDLTYQLIDTKRRKFPVYYDGVLTHILNWEYRDIDVKDLIGKCTICYDFFNKEKEDIINIYNQYKNKLLKR